MKYKQGGNLVPALATMGLLLLNASVLVPHEFELPFATLSSNKELSENAQRINRQAEGGLERNADVERRVERSKIDLVKVINAHEEISLTANEDYFTFDLYSLLITLENEALHRDIDLKIHYSPNSNVVVNHTTESTVENIVDEDSPVEGEELADVSADEPVEGEELADVSADELDNREVEDSEQASNFNISTNELPITLKGKYSDILRFLEHLDMLDMIEVKSFSVKAIEDTGIEADVKLQIFYKEEM